MIQKINIKITKEDKKYEEKNKPLLSSARDK